MTLPPTQNVVAPDGVIVGWGGTTLTITVATVLFTTAQLELF